MGVHSFSIIIPLYNKAHTIERAILSVLNQVDAEAEIIIVDDGSIDGYETVVERYKDKVRLIKQANSGPSAARNHGASKSHYPLLMFLDADDVLLPGCLSAHAESRKWNENTQCSITSYKVNYPDGQEHIEDLSRRVQGVDKVGNSYYFNRVDSRLLSGIHSGSICVDRELFTLIHGFDARLKCWEITDFVIRCMLNGHKTALIDGVFSNKIEEILPQDSQYQMTKHNPEYLSQFARNLMDYMANIEDSEKMWFMGQINNIAYQLWNNGEINSLINISAYSNKHIKGASYRSILNIGKLPKILILILYQIRSLLGRS